MVDILHRVGVVAPLDDVYRAITTPGELARWWTIDTQGESEVGGKLSFRFGDVGGFDMEVVELDPNGRVRWSVIGGPEEWIGTEIDWHLTQSNEYTIILFEHTGLARAGGVHVPLQHQVGDVPDEPQRARRDRHRQARSRRPADQRLALISATLRRSRRLFSVVARS